MLPDVADTSLSTLRALGFRVRSRNDDTWDLVLPNSRLATRTLRGDRGRITLSDARKRGDQAGARALLVASGASDGVLDAARMGRWDVLTWVPARAIVNGITYEAVGTDVPTDAPRRRDRAASADGAPTVPSGAAPGTEGAAVGGHAPSGTHRGGRLPWVRWGVARVLLTLGPQPVGVLAERLGASPQAIRRSLNQLGELVRRSPDGNWTPDAMLEGAWRSAYPGPLGEASTWWHPLPPEGQARAVAMVAGRLGEHPLLTAGSVVTAYVHDEAELRAELQRVGFVAVRADSATLRLVVPRDPTLWATAQPATVAGEGVLTPDRFISGLTG